MSFTIQSTTHINAAPELVWRLLTDLDSWATWNTWLRYEAGELSLGRSLSLRLTPSGRRGFRFTVEVLTMNAPRHLVWVGRMGGGMFEGEHHFVLEERADGTTTFINRERFSGMLAPLVERLPIMKSIRPSFEGMNAELAAHAAELANPDQPDE